jgi:UPF0716 protein FxsA
MWLFVAFLAVPLIEIALFIEIGGAIGLGWTLVIVVATALLGTALVRNQGALALGQLRASFDRMQDPTEPLAHGAMILFSGALLLTPGFFTDTIGFLLLIPAVRSRVFRAVRARIEVRRFGSGQHDPHARHTGAGPRDEVIEAEYTEVTDRPETGRRPSGWTDH